MQRTIVEYLLVVTFAEYETFKKFLLLENLYPEHNSIVEAANNTLYMCSSTPLPHLLHYNPVHGKTEN